MVARRLVASVALAGFGWAIASGAAFAQGNSQSQGGGKGKQGSEDKQGKDKQEKDKQAKDKDKEKDKDGKAAPRPEIGTKDREAISGYFKNNTAGLPPGLAKRGGDLPPGLEKQLQKNGKLPPGLEKKLESVPAPLEKQLSPLPSGYSRRILGTHMLVVNDKTKQIGDVFLNVVR